MMETRMDEDEGPALDALSDEEYDRRVGDAVGDLIGRFEESLASNDEVEAEILHAAAPAALATLLAHVVAEHCVGEPRPYRSVKEMVRDLGIEALALAVLKDLQAADAAAGEA